MPRILQCRDTRACGRGSRCSIASNSPDSTVASRERPVHGSNRLVLAHFWAAFVAFIAAILLGAWQMLVRSPLHRWVDPELYYRAVTAHGTTLAYVFPTLVAMGFGYAVCAVSLGRPMHGVRLAWTAFWLVIAGAVMAIADRGRRQSDGPLHILSAAYRKSLLLPGIIIAVNGFLDLGRFDGFAFRPLEARPPGIAGAARHVCLHGGRAALGLDFAGSRIGDSVP